MATALHAAAQTDRLDVCRYIVEDLGCDIEAKDDGQRTLLFNESGAKSDVGSQPLYVAAQVSTYFMYFLSCRTVT